ncbi:MAG: hypothetical protein H6577_27645 [Lewinellaceae bacterium]|nr:hypothetical protein [Saprospiraceae bacterium]MCB9341919.1 hypothetical protein [Lewinellaceae bacterium]
MISLKINEQDLNPRQILYRHAIQLGLLTALIMAVYELLIHFAHSDTLEGFRILKYIILFAMIGYGGHQARAWIRKEHQAEDSMAFGIVLSVFAAFGVIAFDSLISLCNYHLDISDTFLPIDDGFKFAVNAMATFWGCLIFGFLSSFIFTNYYKRM